MKKNNATRPDGRIAVSVYLGKDETGKRDYKVVYGKTQKEADAKAREIKAQLGRGLDVRAGKGTFEEWGKRLITAKKSEVCKKSVESYQTYINHLNEYIGDKQLDKITTDNIQTIINDFAENNPRTGSPASQRMLKGLKITALQVYEKAVEARALDFNPVMYVRIPKTAPKSHRSALSNEYQQYIKDTPHALQMACMIALHAGLRKGEVLALNW
ncbi:MAG: site-specific integrase, partial [Eubacteriales bacterium]